MNGINDAATDDVHAAATVNVLNTAAANDYCVNYVVHALTIY